MEKHRSHKKVTKNIGKCRVQKWAFETATTGGLIIHSISLLVPAQPLCEYRYVPDKEINSVTNLPFQPPACFTDFSFQYFHGVILLLKIINLEHLQPCKTVTLGNLVFLDSWETPATWRVCFSQPFQLHISNVTAILILISIMCSPYLRSLENLPSLLLDSKGVAMAKKREQSVH